jgi:hypothetical protein
MNRFEELTAKYLDEALSPSEGRELANHLRAEPEAARQFHMLYFQDRVLVELFRSDDLKATESIMAEIRGEESAFVGSVMQRVREQPKSDAFAGLRDKFSRLQNLWRSGFAWSGAAVALLIAFYFFILRPVVGEPVLLVGQGTGVTVERAGRQVAASDKLKFQPNDVLILGGTNAVAITYAPENTHLDLQPGTTLKLLDWTKGKRFDLRQGKLEAAVTRQRPFKPLLVGTPNAEARVLGTKFTLTATTNRTSLVVTEGRVRLTRTSDGAAVKVGAGHYAMVVDGTDMKALPQTGSLLREIWTGIPGSEVNDLLDHPDYPNRPAHRDLLKTFETPVIQTNNYACRLIGYIHPPVTGDYTFWIASGGYAALWLSPDENPVNKARIAAAFGGMPREWDPPNPHLMGKFQMAQSPKIRLVAGRRYFIQAMQKTASGSAHLEVAWRIPDAEREIISGEFLSPFKTTTKPEEKQR